MPITAKATMFLEDDSGAGWSESFYCTAANLNAAQTLIDTFIPDAMDCRPASVACVYARVSDVAVRGDSLLSTLPFPVPGTYVLPTGATQMEPGAAVLVQLFASATVKGHWFFRGGPSSILQGREFVTGTTWDAAFGLAAATLIASFQIRHKTSPGPPPVYAYTNMTSVTPERGTTRRVGRPFGLPVGRRK